MNFYGLFAKEVSSGFQFSKKQMSENFIYKLIKKCSRSVKSYFSFSK